MIPAARAVAGLWEKYEVLCAMLHPIGFRPGELQRTPNPEKLFFDAYNLMLESEQNGLRTSSTRTLRSRRWYALARTQPAAIELRDDVGFFNKLAGEVRKITAPEAQASQVAEQAVRQFFSEGLAAGEVIDVFGIADKDRPEISVLSDEFLDSISKRTDHPNVQVRLLEKLLNDEIRGRMRANQMQAKLFGEQVSAVLPATSSSSSPAPRSSSGSSRLPSSSVTLATATSSSASAKRRPRSTTRSLVVPRTSSRPGSSPRSPTSSSRASARDLTVDWADREATEAKIRAKIKRLLRKHAFKPRARDGGGGGGDRHGLDYAAQLVLDQAKALYRYWPEVEVGDRLFL